MGRKESLLHTVCACSNISTVKLCEVATSKYVGILKMFTASKISHKINVLWLALFLGFPHIFSLFLVVSIFTVSIFNAILLIDNT